MQNGKLYLHSVRSATNSTCQPEPASRCHNFAATPRQHLLHVSYGGQYHFQMQAWRRRTFPNLSRETDSRSHGQHIPRLLQKPNVHDRVHNSLPPYSEHTLAVYSYYLVTTHCEYLQCIYTCRKAVDGYCSSIFICFSSDFILTLWPWKWTFK